MNKRQMRNVALLLLAFLFVFALVQLSTKREDPNKVANKEIFEEVHIIDDIGRGFIRPETTPFGEPTIDLTVAMNGLGHVTIYQICGPTECDMSLIGDATVEGMKLAELLPQLVASLYPNVQPALQIEITVQRIDIGVDPSTVKEEGWMGPAAAKIAPGCTKDYKTCIREVEANLMKANEYQFAAVFFVTQERPISPKSGNPISGYAYNSGIGVVAANNGFVQACRLGLKCQAVWHFMHELFHMFGAQHPDPTAGITVNTARFGYFAGTLTATVDIMGDITSELVIENTWKTIGVIDSNQNGVFDIHETSVVITCDPISGNTLTCDAISVPAPPMNPIYEPINYQKLSACVRVSGGNCLKMTVHDSDAPREHFTVDLPSGWQSKMVTVSAESKYRGVVFSSGSKTVNMPTLNESLYLPMVTK